MLMSGFCWNLGAYPDIGKAHRELCLKMLPLVKSGLDAVIGVFCPARSWPRYLILRCRNGD